MEKRANLGIFTADERAAAQGWPVPTAPPPPPRPQWRRRSTSRSRGARHRSRRPRWLKKVTLEPDAFAAQKKLVTETIGVSPAMEMDGVTVFQFPDGSILELYTPQAVPDFGYNGAVAFGFRVDDVERASAELAAAGAELLGEINRFPDLDYAFRHFRDPDGRVYGLNENEPQPR